MLATAPVQSLEESFPLLNADEGNVGFAAPAAAPSDDLASSFPSAVESPVVESPAMDPSDNEVPSDSSDAIGGADSMLGGSPE